MALPSRKDLRLKNYDYGRDGAYFITICTNKKAYLFGEAIAVGADLVSAQMALNYAGRMIECVFLETVQSFAGMVVDKYVVMPNHFHCIIVVGRADTRFAPTGMKTVSDVVQAFKSKSTLEYIKGMKAGMLPPFDKRIWQRNYYEHVIRDERDYQTKWQYIDENPMKWADDIYYCDKRESV